MIRSNTLKKNDNKTIQTNWEYHPVYGLYSRLIYQEISKDTYRCIGREYKDLKGNILD